MLNLSSFFKFVLSDIFSPQHFINYLQKSPPQKKTSQRKNQLNFLTLSLPQPPVFQSTFSALSPVMTPLELISLGGGSGNVDCNTSVPSCCCIPATVDDVPRGVVTCDVVAPPPSLPEVNGLRRLLDSSGEARVSRFFFVLFVFVF